MTDLPDPLVGRVLKGTWRIEVFVARGSMGAVYRGSNTQSGRPVAVKVLNPELLHDEELRERFRREATVSARCDSAHLVKVLDLVTDQEGYICLVMEWLAGETLGDYLKRRGQLVVPEAVALVGEIGEGLHEAHLAGIVHRDLKPGNIFLARVGHTGLIVPKIVDFGISKILEAGAALTGTATMMGTPHYMPVEQFDSSRDVDQRADIYALGVITYELLAGHRPYRGLTPMAILNQVATADPPPLPEDVPGSVAAVVAKAMARQAEDRYPAVLDYCEALLGAAREVGLAPSPTDSPSTTLGLSLSTGALPTLPGPPPWRRWLARHRLTGIVVLAVLAVLGLSVGLWMGLPSEAPPRAEDAPAPAPSDLGPLEVALPGPGDGARGLAVDALGERALGASSTGQWTRWSLARGAVEARGGAGGRGEADAQGSMTAPTSGPGSGPSPGSGQGVGPVASVALSADGRWQALGMEAGQIALREVAGTRSHWLRFTAGPEVTALSFSADGNRLIAGGAGGEVSVWDVRTGRLQWALTSAGGAVTAVALDGDGGRALVGRADGDLVYWDLRARRLLTRLSLHSKAITGLVMPPPGGRGASSSLDGTLRTWAPAGREAGPAIGGQAGEILSLAASEDGGLLLTGGADGVARLFDAQGRLVGRTSLPGPITRVALCQGGALRLVAGPALPVLVFRERRAAAPRTRR